MPRRRGTRYDWYGTERLVPLPIEDPERVDERRHSVGLGPPEEDTRRLRAETACSGERTPQDRAERQRRWREWGRSVGRHD